MGENRMKNKKVQSSVVGAAGEHLVLSELLKRGYIAGLAPFNVKDYDIVVLNQDGTNSFPIQVKTTASNKRGWIMQDKHEKPIKDLYYCFVFLSEKLSDTEIFIIDSKNVANFLKFTHSIWLKVPGKNGKKHNDSKMRMLGRGINQSYINDFEKIKKLLTEKEQKFILSMKKKDNAWIEQFRNAWDLIKV